jgi:ABC-type Na+ transport system ATPase subunit NatA
VTTGRPEPGSEEIVVQHLTKQYKQLRAVDDLSFSVRSGRVTGFLGPNGAGKTTTLRVLTFPVTPRRERVVLAKLAAAVLLGLVFWLSRRCLT